MPDIQSKRFKTGYHQRNEGAFTRAVRKFLVRNPKTFAYAMAGSVFIGFMIPTLRNIKMRMTLSKEEYIDWHNRYNAVVADRRVSFSNWYIPLITKDIAMYQDETTEEIFQNTKMLPRKTSKY
uniref:Transmembrane protein n=1 Tax=Ditylenchus dipsaci TaxID=166011 RepID=A0A915CPL4_9BILA